MLASKDQLLQEAERSGHVFNGYCEGTLTFKPTYKYNVGSSKYDTSYKVPPFLRSKLSNRMGNSYKIQRSTYVNNINYLLPHAALVQRLRGRPLNA